MTLATARAVRAALEARINARAADEGVEAGRVRRRLVFQRLVRRLAADDSWIVKGAYALEARLGHGARTTRDLDVATASAGERDVLLEELGRLLAVDADGDFFRFRVTRMTAAGPPDARGPAWRVSLTAVLDGRPFDHVRLDVVARTDEVAHGTERLEIGVPVPGLPWSPAACRAVDVAQHAAEKYHALCRVYAGGRPSTRVKDLVDLVLMNDAGLLPDPRLRARLHAVFEVRDHEAPPTSLPTLPESWTRDYAVLSAATAATVVHLDEALVVAERIYRDALDDERG